MIVLIKSPIEFDTAKFRKQIARMKTFRQILPEHHSQRVCDGNQTLERSAIMAFLNAGIVNTGIGDMQFQPGKLSSASVESVQNGFERIRKTAIGCVKIWINNPQVVAIFQ